MKQYTFASDSIQMCLSDGWVLVLTFGSLLPWAILFYIVTESVYRSDNHWDTPITAMTMMLAAPFIVGLFVFTGEYVCSLS